MSSAVKCPCENLHQNQVHELIKEMKNQNKNSNDNYTITSEEAYFLEAYRSADARTRKIVDAALEPYKPHRTFQKDNVIYTDIFKR